MGSTVKVEGSERQVVIIKNHLIATLPTVYVSKFIPNRDESGDVHVFINIEEVQVDE